MFLDKVFNFFSQQKGARTVHPLLLYKGWIFCNENEPELSEKILDLYDEILEKESKFKNVLAKKLSKKELMYKRYVSEIDEALDQAFSYFVLCGESAKLEKPYEIKNIKKIEDIVEQLNIACEKIENISVTLQKDEPLILELIQ